MTARDIERLAIIGPLIGMALGWLCLHPVVVRDVWQAVSSLVRPPA
jgi:hypothetical protein